jgi:hypothetical protein
VIRRCVFVPQGAVVQIAEPEFPVFLFVLESFLEAFLLLAALDVQKKLENHNGRLDEHALEVVDLRVAR